jgi:DNA invertase Pin-like site-specific DNA recombinase
MTGQDGRVRVISYLRVSTDKQANHGLGLDVQESDVLAWTQANGHQLVATYRDVVSGTKDVAERPGLAEALRAIKDGEAEGLVIPRLDRLARRLDIQEAALAHVWRAGGRVFACDFGEILADDPDDPYRTAMRQVVGVFSQLERSMLTARMKAGRKRKAADGGYAYGAPPMGKVAVGGKLVAVGEKAEKEREVINKAVELYAQDGATLRRVAAQLNEAGLKSKRGKQWYSANLGRVLRREGVVIREPKW